MKMKNKLRTHRGESLVETLVGLLIAALAVTMMAGAITSSINMIRSSSNRMKAYYEKNNLLEELPDTVPDDAGVTKEEEKLNITILAEEESENKTLNPVTVTLFIHEEGDAEIISYKEPSTSVFTFLEEATP